MIDTLDELIRIRVFKNKWFVRFARKQGIKDVDLCDAIANVERGVIDADLGSGVIKQRIARPGEGKSGGFRSVVLLRSGGDTAFFVYGFAKSARSNIRWDELEGLRALADVMLGYDETALARALETGAIVEVQCDE